MKSVFLILLLAVALEAATFRANLRKTAKVPKKIRRSPLVHQNHRFGLKDNSMGSMPLEYEDIYYVLEATLGSPPQTFLLRFTTTSADMWITDKNCVSASCEESPVISNYTRRHYDSAKSSTYKPTGRQFVIDGNDGVVKGTIGSDLLSLNQLHVFGQTFGQATEVFDTFMYEEIDGQIGLGFPALAVDGITPPLLNLMPLLDKQLFTLWVQGKPDPAEFTKDGLLTFGAFDTEHCSSDVNWVSLSLQTYWTFPIQGFTVGSSTVAKKYQAVMGTSTSFILGPPSDIDMIVAEAGGEYDSTYDLFHVDCSAETASGGITFMINGREHHVPAASYIEKTLRGDGKCLMTIRPSSTGAFSAAWVFGTAVIRHHCAIFDYGNLRIGFAEVI